LNWEVKYSGAASAEKVDNRQQDNGAKQRDQHGRDRDGIIDRSDFEYWAEEIACNKGADNRHNDVEQQVRAIMHDFSGYPPNDRGNDKVYKKVHYYLQFECLLMNKELCAYKAFWTSSIIS